MQYDWLMSMPINQTINWDLSALQYLLNDNNSIPRTAFSNNNTMRTFGLLYPNSIPFLVEPCTSCYKIESSHSFFQREEQFIIFIHNF